MEIVEIGIRISILVVGVFVLANIKKVKNKLKRFVLRGGIK